MKKITLKFLATLALANCAAAVAEDYPHKPIRLIVGFSAGGSADIGARTVAKKLGDSLRTSFVIDNRGGYTLLWGSVGALTITQILEKNLPYNTDTAFAPVGLALIFCNALIARQDSPVRSVAQLIALAKDKPGSLNYGTQGIGSAGYLSGELLKSMTGASFAHVPYKGANEILTAVISGELQISFVSATAAGALRNRIQILAVTSLNRDPSLPDVPSMHEAGVKNYDATFWYGLLAPAGTPPAIVNRLSRDLRQALVDPEIARPVQAQGLNPAPSSPQEYAARIKADYAKWKKIIAGI